MSDSKRQSSAPTIAFLTALLLSGCHPGNDLRFEVSGPATVRAGEGTAFTVTVRDRTDRLVSEFRGRIHFESREPSVLLPADYSFTAADAGSRAFTLSQSKAGSLDVTVTLAKGSSGIMVAPGGAVSLVAAGPVTHYFTDYLPYAQVQGQTNLVQLSAIDDFWNVVTTYNGQASITTTDPLAIIPTAPVQFVNGVAANIPVTFESLGGRTFYANDTVTPSLGDSAWVNVSAGPPNPTITAAAKVTTGQANLTASVVAQGGATYAWSITNGTITAGAATNVVTYSAGAVGTAVLSCTVTNASNASATGTFNESVVAAPVATITAPSTVSAGMTGLTASVPLQSGASYAWTIVNGTITGGATSNQVVFTAGSPGTLTLSSSVTNAAGAVSNGTASVSVVTATTPPVITAASPVFTGATGRTASVPARAGMTYSWSLLGVGGTITSANGAAGVTSGGVNSITYTAGPVGTLVLNCVETNVAGDSSAPGTANVTIQALDGTPQIVAASPVTSGATGLTASVTAKVGATYSWTIAGGTITGTGGAGGVTSGTTNTLTYTAGPVGTITLTCVEHTAILLNSPTGTATVNVIAQPATPSLTTASTVTTGATGISASVVARAGMTYKWTVTGGTITSAGGAAGTTNGGVNSIAYTAGAPGSATVSCAEINAAGTASSPAVANVTVAASPVVPTITAASPVTSGATGLTASVTARSGMTYAWQLSSGTITSAGGAAGVTSGTTNSITYTAGAPGSLSLTAVETNQAGASSAPGTATVNVVAVPDPTITAPSSVGTGAAGLIASVASQAGSTYAWTIANGTITAGASTNSVTFTAGAVGTLTLTCVVTNSAGTSRTGTASVTVASTPSAPVITVANPLTAGATGVVASVPFSSGMTYAWTITGGTLTNAGGAAGVNSTTTNSITFTVGGPGTLSLTCVQTNAAGSSPAGVARARVNLPAGPPSDVYVVAHEDDDLLFMNPDVDNGIQAGHASRTVYVTAGENGSTDPNVWINRENGMKAAYAAMARQANSWNCANRTYLGNKVVLHCVLAGNNLVTLTFMHLKDGWVGTYWTGTTTYPTVDGLSSYTRQDIINVLGAILSEASPSRIGTLDSSLAYGRDHADHQYSAFFAMEASHAYAMPHEIRLYRGYNIDDFYGSALPIPEIENISPAEHDEKRNMFVAYYGPIGTGDQYDSWCARQYALSRVYGGTGPLFGGTNGQCLDVAGGSTANGTAVTLTTCSDAARQRWTLTTTGLIQGPAGKCLEIASDLATAQINDCTGSSPQKWDYVSNGMLKSINGLCLTAVSGGPTVQATTCTPNTSGNLYQIDPTQQWTQQFKRTSQWSVGSQFSDADVGSASTYYATVQLGDVNGDGFADACVRRSDGVYCALNNQAGGFGSYTLYSSAFSDSAGWLADKYGSTVQLADVNGDGKADVCGRNASGIVCALANAAGTAFGPVTQWSTGFSDSAGFGGGPTYYRSIHFADVDGDGAADVCGRRSDGIYCAISNKSTGFFTATNWLSTDFTDALGWTSDMYGTTIMLGDVNGDGRADVCGRGPNNVRCATSTGSSFINSRPNSLRSEFSDSAGWGAGSYYYGTLRLADVNGDGYADLCGRGPNGVVCAFSNGGHFDRSLPVVTRDLTDAQGWNADKYATTLRFGRLDADSHLDLCVRGPAGLQCAIAP
jgi:LmbE family N-acetylglucosaminyl deacetylase